jgi:phosphate-selective porin OprO/OprP
LAWSEETTVSPAPGAPEQRLEKIERELAALQQQATADTEEPLQQPEEAVVATASPDGFSLKSSDSVFQLRLKGYAQFDGRSFLAVDKVPAVDTFLMRRVRPILEGTLARNFEFRIMPDFGAGSVTLQEAYLEFKWMPEVNVRAGRFKVPVGLERLQSSANTTFVELALPTNLTPNYDLGYQVAGNFLNGSLSYQTGVFNGVPDNGSSDSDTQNYKDAAARISAQPFKATDWEPLRGLSLGAGWSYGKNLGSVSSPSLPSYKTPGQLTFFNYRSDGSNTGTAVANGDLRRFSPQATYYYGPLGVLAEYIASSQPVKIGANQRDIRNEAWQVTTSFVLTGENASYTGVNPRTSLDLSKGTWGAWELAGRFSTLLVSADAFPLFADPAKVTKNARAWAYGINGYLNKNVKIQADYEQTVFEYGATAKGNRENESVILTRVQFAY